MCHHFGRAAIHQERTSPKALPDTSRPISIASSDAEDLANGCSSAGPETSAASATRSEFKKDRFRRRHRRLLSTGSARPQRPAVGDRLAAKAIAGCASQRTSPSATSGSRWRPASDGRFATECDHALAVEPVAARGAKGSRTTGDRYRREAIALPSRRRALLCARDEHLWRIADFPSSCGLEDVAGSDDAEGVGVTAEARLPR